MNKCIPDPLYMIHEFNDTHRTKFNPKLFESPDEGIIEALKNVILSCQRDTFFTVRVEGFDVIEDYAQIIDILKEKEKAATKNNMRENVYEYINLKSTAMRLLVVHYYIAIKDESKYVDAYIGVPRVVDKYYFRINGNIYSSLLQIVDASTYNSATSSSKRSSITFKTQIQPLPIYRYQTNKKTDLIDHVTGETVRCTYYTSYVFKKSLLVMKYMLAKYGFYGAMEFLCLDYVFIYDHDPLEDGIDPSMVYVFTNHGIYIMVPRELFDKLLELQSFVFTLYMNIDKDTKYQEFFSRDYWLIALAMEFNNKTVEKGESVLVSLEFVVDIDSREMLALPDEDKKDVYHIMRWMIGEFTNLMIKSNIDVSIKRVRRKTYISSLYAMKLSTAIYRISDIGKKASLESIEKALCTSPVYLLNAIANCNLVTYRNYVNDMDALVALKYTYKGIAGIGEKNNALPNIYRAVNKYQLGILDPDASSAGDPGASGTFCPSASVYENGMLSEFQEPNTWEATVRNTIATYKKAVGIKECLIAVDKMLDGDTNEEQQRVQETIDLIDNVVKPLINDATDMTSDVVENISAASYVRIGDSSHKSYSLHPYDLLVYEIWEGEEYGE